MRLIAFFTIPLCLLLALNPSVGQAETIAYWAQNDNSLPGGGFGFTPASFPQPADGGSLAVDATLSLGNFDENTSGPDDAYDCIGSFAGTTSNAPDGVASGGSLSPQGCTGETTNNGMHIEISASTAGFENIILSWAQRGTSSGFTSRQLAWSADGGVSFTDFGSDTGALGSSWSIQAYDLSAVTALHDNPDVVFRITLDGATGASGNNRFDNIRIDGDALSGGGPGTTPIPYELEFSTDPFSAGFSVANVSGLDNWGWNSSFNNVTFSSFDGACVPTESWFISPAFDLDAQDDELLFVDIQRGFSGDDGLDLLFSTDYAGTGDPNAATWTLLDTATAGDFSSNNTPVTFGPYDALQSASGTAYVAARGLYETGSCSTWRISRFEIALDQGPGDFACVADPSDDVNVTRIHAIQGDGFASPLAGPPGQAGDSVEVQAIVVGTFQDDASNQLGGFFLQEPDARHDGDPLTSEGIYISPEQAATVLPQLAIGDEVRVAGAVRENFGQTEVFQVAALEVCGNDLLDEVSPAALALPVADPIELEAVEGMWTIVPQALTVTEVFNAARFAEFAAAPERLFQPTQVALPGAPANAVQALNELSRVIIDQGQTGAYNMPFQPGLDGTPLNASNPIRVGYRMQPDFEGIMGFAFSNYRLFALEPVVFDDSDNPRTSAPPALPEGNLRVASFNVENLFGTVQTGGVGCGPNNLDCRGATSEAELARQLIKLVEAIIAMEVDLVGLMEVENDADDDTLALLVDALNAVDNAGDWAFVATGHAGTDAIKNAILYRDTVLSPVGQTALLDGSVAVTPPFDDSRQRPVLTQAFEHLETERVMALSVFHLRSKNCGSNASGPNLDQGDGQGCWNALRTESVESFLNWLVTDPTGTGTDLHLISGDFNAYGLEDPVQALVTEGFVDQIIRANDDDPAVYSFVFRGQSGSLGHALASSALEAMVLGASPWPINADEIPAFAYPETLPSSSIDKPADFFSEDPFRSSDHDPLIVSLQIEPPPEPATVELAGLVQTFTGDPLEVLVTTDPPGLEVEVRYDGELTPPTQTGSYAVEASVTEPGFVGSASAAFMIEPAAADLLFDQLIQLFTGDPLAPVITTVPVGLNVTVTYNGSAAAPVAVGDYAVVVQIDEPNYTGSETVVFRILDPGPQSLNITAQPGGRLLLGKVLTPALVVEVLDATGAVASGDNDTIIEVAIVLGGQPTGSLRQAFASAQVANGVAEFSDLSILQPGTGYRLLVRDAEGQLGLALSDPFDILGDSVFADGFEDSSP